MLDQLEPPLVDCCHWTIDPTLVDVSKVSKPPAVSLQTPPVLVTDKIPATLGLFTVINTGIEFCSLEIPLFTTALKYIESVKLEAV